MCRSGLAVLVSGNVSGHGDYGDYRVCWARTYKVFPRVQLFCQSPEWLRVSMYERDQLRVSDATCLGVLAKVVELKDGFGEGQVERLQIGIEASLGGPKVGYASGSRYARSCEDDYVLCCALGRRSRMVDAPLPDWMSSATVLSACGPVFGALACLCKELL